MGVPIFRTKGLLQILIGFLTSLLAKPGETQTSQKRRQLRLSAKRWRFSAIMYQTKDFQLAAAGVFRRAVVLVAHPTQKQEADKK